MIIGLTGGYCSGKDVVAQYLMDKGYVHYSLSDYLREELGRRGTEVTRDNLIKLGNELRTKYGPPVLAEKMLDKIKENQDYVISSIRSPGEVSALRKRKDFLLVWIDAPLKVRFSRMQKRGRKENELKTLSEFKKSEARENSKNKAGQQLNKCRKLAAAILNNDKTKELLYKKMDKMLYDLRIKSIEKKRPAKERYYINIAKEVAERSTCLSSKGGAVIVKDDQIIATGYIGAPRKTASCIERGNCLRRKLKIPSGQRYEICRSVHAEQNAIINAARAGVSLLGADMYTYGFKIHDGQYKLFRLFPCFICKKMIINAGLRRVICTDEKGNIEIHNIANMVKEWQRKDMIEDQIKYDAKYK